MALIGKGLSVAILVLCAGGASAAEEMQAYKLAGEIILTPTGSGKSGSGSATDHRERARSYGSENSGAASASGATILVIPDEEEDLFSRRSVPSNQSKAREYRDDAGSYSQPRVLILPGQDAARPETPHERIETHRLKARAYMKGETPAGVAGTASTSGVDGLVLVNCRDANSVSGRIGDDTQSGSVISVFQNGKPVKVRCK